jgi:hypothetical protein
LFISLASLAGLARTPNSAYFELPITKAIRSLLAKLLVARRINMKRKLFIEEEFVNKVG